MSFLGWRNLLRSIPATYFISHPVDSMQLRAMQTPPTSMMDLSVSPAVTPDRDIVGGCNFTRG